MRENKQKLSNKEFIKKIEQKYNNFSKESLSLYEKQKQLINDYRKRLENIKKQNRDKN